MNKEEALALIVKYTENTATQAEKELVEQYVSVYLSDNKQLPGISTIEDANVEIWKHIEKHIKIRRQPARFIGLWPKIAVAASLFLAVGTGLFFAGYFETNRVEVVNALDVPPGKNRAVLTFADGRKVQLSDKKNGLVIGEELMYSDGTEVKSSAQEHNHTGQILTASTPRGGTYKITLSDGTDVWLNAGSSLKFPAHFGKEERKVELTGEGYFEVAKSEAKGKYFLVETQNHIVKVLGTHFNINSYAVEPYTATTLLEGSVSIVTGGKEHNDSIVLKPNQQAILTGTNRDNVVLKVKQVDSEEVIAWKEGYFDFNEEKLERIMNKIARWYDVTIVYEDPKLKEQSFSGNISKFNNVSEVLKKLALSKVLRFKIDGRKIIVTH